MPAKNGSPRATPPGALQERRSRVPVVDVEHVERRPVPRERGERRPRPGRRTATGRPGSRRTRRGRTPPARPRGAAGSRPPRRRGSARRAASRHAGRRSTAAPRRPRSPAPARIGSAAAARRPAPPSSEPASGRRPSARASASTTSARPPVLAHGSHSAARSATRIGMRRIVARRVPAAANAHGSLNRFTHPSTPAIMGRQWSPSSASPSRPARRSPSRPSWKAFAASPTTCGGAGTRGPGSCSRGSTPAPGPATATRSRCCRAPSTGRSSSTTRRSWPTTRTILREFDTYMANGADHWFQRKHGDQLDGPDRLLLRRVRLPRVAGDLLGRPRGARGRPHEDGVGHGAAAGRRRPDVPARVLPPDDRRGRPPGARLPRLRAGAAADPARARPPRASRSRSASSSPAATCSPRCGWPRSAGCRCCCSTRTCPTTTTRTARSRTSCTSAAARCGSTRSWCWASAACGCCAQLGLEPSVWHLNEGHSAFLLAERARELVAGRRDRSTTPGTRSVATACSRSTPRSRRATSGSTRTSSAGSRARCSTATAGRHTGGVPIDRSCSSSGMGGRGRREPVRHDGASRSG